MRFVFLDSSKLHRNLEITNWYMYIGMILFIDKKKISNINAINKL